jgi:hypothetical protein
VRLALALAAAVALAAPLAACTNAGGPQGSPGTRQPAPRPVPDAEAFLDDVQQRTFRWFWETTNPRNGLTPDRWPTKSFSSIAAVGFALTAYPIGVERGWVTREEARDRALTTLRFFWTAPMGAQASGVAGHMGFFYHFLDMETGHRFQTVELSTIDTTLLLGGVLFCREYFDRPDAAEAEIRALADSIYFRVDWRFALPPDEKRLSMGWKPEEGLLGARWEGLNEAMLLYVLAFASPTHPVDSTAWDAWTSTYRWGSFQGYEHVNFGPLFGHQYSHVWIDFRGIRDAYMRGRGIDYFENSRRATLSQRAYAQANPMGWRGYGGDIWGLTASDGPKDTAVTWNGARRQFWTYSARAAALGEIRDDGTIVPTAAGGSVPFAPEVTIPALYEMKERHGDALYSQYGFLDAFNETFPRLGIAPQMGRNVGDRVWVDGDYLGIDQGPILIMIENHRTGLVWRYMRRSPYIRRGLERAGFTGGWLAGESGQ